MKEAQRVREETKRSVGGLIGDGALICLPTAPGAAPRRDTPADELDRFRGRALCLLSAAGLCSLPQLSLPLGEMERCPLGLSLIAASGRDVDLLALAAELLPRTPLD